MGPFCSSVLFEWLLSAIDKSHVHLTMPPPHTQKTEPSGDKNSGNDDSFLRSASFAKYKYNKSPRTVLYNWFCLSAMHRNQLGGGGGAIVGNGRSEAFRWFRASQQMKSSSLFFCWFSRHIVNINGKRKGKRVPIKKISRTKPAHVLNFETNNRYFYIQLKQQH